MSKQPTWNDLKEASSTDLKRIYHLDSRGLEKAVRRHLDGANAQERREVYQETYKKKD